MTKIKNKVWRYKFEKWYNKSERLIEVFPVVGIFWDHDSFCLHFGWIMWECQIWRMKKLDVLTSFESNKTDQDES
jgi:hypothetical protein